LTELPILPSSNVTTPTRAWPRKLTRCRKTHGHAIILRGHDFRLRSPPADAMAKAFPPSPSPARRGFFAKGREPSAYVPLRVHSHYSFLDSTLSPAAIVKLAQQHGICQPWR
jgi:hypothetical protein